MRSQKIQSFWITFTMGSAATVWLLRHPMPLLWLMVIPLAAAVLWCLPWQPRGLLQKGALGAAMLMTTVLGLDAAWYTAPHLPLWQWTLGWLLLWGVLHHVGLTALAKSGALPGLLLLVLSLGIWPAAAGQMRLPVGEVSFSLTSVLPAVVLLYGCCLTGRELSSHPSAARLGGLTAMGLWCMQGLLPRLLWSGAALDRLSHPLAAAWQRISLLNLVFCPDVLLCALTAVLCLWQGAAGWMLLQGKKM